MSYVCEASNHVCGKLWPKVVVRRLLLLFCCEKKHAAPCPDKFTAGKQCTAFACLRSLALRLPDAIHRPRRLACCKPPRLF